MNIADRWFERQRIDDGITLLWEPHVDPLIRCNIWHVKGRDGDLLVDTGLGIVSLRSAAKDIFDKHITAVATHTHYDHIGGMHEFDRRIVHEREAAIMSEGLAEMVLRFGDFSEADRRELNALGYGVDCDELISALPHADFESMNTSCSRRPVRCRLQRGTSSILAIARLRSCICPVTRRAASGSGKNEPGVLFSGDAIYDGPLLTNFPGADIDQYVDTMHRLRTLPVRVVHGGHEDSFGRERLVEIADKYLKLWQHGMTSEPSV